MEFQSRESDFCFRYEQDSVESAMLSPEIYDDHLQTVPDLEYFDTGNPDHKCYAEQAVPEQCLYGLQLSPECETTPVRMEGAVFLKNRKITPFAITFNDDSSDSSSVRSDSVSRSKPTKRRSKNRRSYLSNDLPVEIRNRRRTVANARERARVGRMANGYAALQKALPTYLTGNKMRKVDILNSAVCYIQNLMQLLSEAAGKTNGYTSDDNGELRNRFRETVHQNIQNDITEINKNTLDCYITIPNIYVDSCSFLEQ